MALLLLFLIALVPTECLTDYTASLSFGPALLLALSIGAFLFEAILVWRESRPFGTAGMVAFFGALALSFVLALPLLGASLFTVFDASSFSQSMSGRLSPELSYRIVLAESWFGGGTFYRYEIYANPPRFPFVQKRIQIEPVPWGCQDPDGLASHRIVPEISLGPDMKTLHLTCLFPGGQVYPETSADVKLQN